jgi:hypothetical protein
VYAGGQSRCSCWLLMPQASPCARDGCKGGWARALPHSSCRARLGWVQHRCKQTASVLPQVDQSRNPSEMLLADVLVRVPGVPS